MTTMNPVKIAVINGSEDDSRLSGMPMPRGGSFSSLNVTGSRKEDDERVGDEQVQIFDRLAHRPQGLRQWLIGRVLDSADDLRIGGVGIDDWHMAGWGSDPNTRKCQEIPRQVNLVAQGDIYGYWSTNPRYSINASAFEISFQGSNITTDQYVATMSMFRTQMKALSAKSSRRDAGWNAMFWATFELVDPSTQMSFYSTADAKVIYAGDWTTGVLSSASGGMCNNAYQWSEFDTSTSRLKYMVPTKPLAPRLMEGYYTANATGPSMGPMFMMDFINASWGGYDACYDQFPALEWRSWETSPFTNSMELSFDIRTTVTVISLNLQIENFRGLFSTPPAFGPQSSGNIPGSWWVDPKYIPMDPLFCVDKQALSDRHIMHLTNAQIQGPPLCFLVSQTKTTPVFYYPATISMYMDVNGNPFHCECPRDQHISDCNARNYLFGFFYDLDRTNLTKSIQFALRLQKFLIDDPLNGDKKAQDYLYPFLASTWYIAPPGGPVWATTPSFMNASITSEELHRQQWDILCPWGTCGVVAFSSARDQSVSAFLPLNKYNFQARESPANNRTFGLPPNVLKQEMCTNTVYSDAMFNNFITFVPSPFVQPYFECQKRAFAAFQEAAGNAAGIAGGLSAVGMLLFGILFKFIQNCRASHQRVKDRPEHDPLEKLPSRVRIGDPRFQVDIEGGKSGHQRLNPSLIGFHHKERLIRSLKDAKDESLLLVVESLVENSQRQREDIHALMQRAQQQHLLHQQLQAVSSYSNRFSEDSSYVPSGRVESSTRVGVSSGRSAIYTSNIPSRAENELIERLDGLRNIFEFDIDKAQLLSEMKRVKTQTPSLTVKF